MPRKKPPSQTPGKPQPPRTLKPEGRALWIEITALYPADHFAGANLALLSSLCRAHQVIDECDHLVDRNGIFTEGRANPALAVREIERRSFISIAMKLRLPISSTMRSDTADARPDPKHSLRKPWEIVKGGKQ
jgi:phage terminase small subunit